MSKKNKATAAPAVESGPGQPEGDAQAPATLDKKSYREELAALQMRLVKLQEWATQKHVHVAVLLEGLGPAGKGATAKRIDESLQRSACEVLTLEYGSKRDSAKQLFRHFADQLAQGRKLLILDGSWYHLAAMDYARGMMKPEEFAAFLNRCVEFEQGLAASGVTLIKYWFTAGDATQDARFRAHLEDLRKAGAIHAAGKDAAAPVPVAEVREAILAKTGEPFAWRVIEAEDKRQARLACMTDLLQEAEHALAAIAAARAAGKAKRGDKDKPNS